MSFVTQSKFASTATTAEKNLANAAFQMVADLRNGNALQTNPNLGKALLSNESFSQQHEQEAHAMMSELDASIESFGRTNALAQQRGGLNPQQREAAKFALMSAMNPRHHITRGGNTEQHVTKGAFDVYIPDTSGIDPAKLPQATLEAYDTKPNDEMLNFTAAFALATATQNRFAELFYKTVNLAPDQYAISMEIPLISVHPQIRHELEKRLTDFQRRNIVNVEIDHKILHNDTLKIVPVVRAQTVDAFVDNAQVAPSNVVLESGETVSTAPLKTNYRASLFRLAQTDAQLAKSTLDQTDALDPGAILTAVYLEFSNADGSTKEVVKINTRNAPLNQFTETIQGPTRLMQLQFTTDAVAIGKNTTKVNGQASTLLSAFQGNNASTAWLTFSVRGDINLQDSSYEVVGGSVYVNQVKNSSDQVVSLTDTAGLAIAALFARTKIIGFDLDVSKVNSNLRELGQLADFNTYRQVYGVSLGSPLTIQRPITNGDGQDALHAASLSYLCKARQSNKAVTQLLSEVDTLKEYKKRTDIVGRQPEIMGISSYLVEPVYEELEIDLLTQVTTGAQHQRNNDIRAILTDATRIIAYKLWQMSNWQAAANLLEGTEAKLPVVKLGTDMVLTQYLNIEGDTRTVGPDFSYEKGWSPDERVRNKIFIALGYPSANPGVPHPLDKGIMLNKPEVVAALNLSRSSHSRELIVHPSFRHIPLCPVLGVITVKNLKEALTTAGIVSVTVTNPDEFPSPTP